jgi:hypothetical protein
MITPCAGQTTDDMKLISACLLFVISITPICDTVPDKKDSLLFNWKDPGSRLYNLEVQVMDSINTVIRITRTIDGKDTMIVYDSLRAIKTLMEQLVRCQKENKKAQPNYYVW